MTKAGFLTGTNQLFRVGVAQAGCLEVSVFDGEELNGWLSLELELIDYAGRPARGWIPLSVQLNQNAPKMFVEIMFQRTGRGASGGPGGVVKAMESPTLAMRNTEAGPHRCDRINPSTGKPCNSIFARPYDLTRHEDTIHNARKQKVRCALCVEEKTFSRNDALTRHMVRIHGRR